MSELKKYEIGFNKGGDAIYRDHVIVDDKSTEYYVYRESKLLFKCSRQIEALEWIDNHLDNKTVEVTVKDDSIVYKGYEIKVKLIHSSGTFLGFTASEIDGLDYKDCDNILECINHIDSLVTKYES